MTGSSRKPGRKLKVELGLPNEHVRSIRNASSATNSGRARTWSARQRRGCEPRTFGSSGLELFNAFKRLDSDLILATGGGLEGRRRVDHFRASDQRQWSNPFQAGPRVMPGAIVSVSEVAQVANAA
jgi:hypothetical protein